MSDPDVQHARQALAELEMLVVQDIFLTETAYLADVILPASAFPEKTGTFTNTDRHGAARPAGARRRPARRGRISAIIIDMAQRARPRLALRAPARRVRRNAHGDAVDRRHHVGAARARARRHLSVRARRRSRRSASCSPTIFRPRRGRAKLVPAQIDSRGRATRRRVSVRPDHRPPARALAHRQHDAPHRGARRDRAGAGGFAAIRWTSRRWASAPGDIDHRRIAPRQHFAVRARRRAARRAARCSSRSATTRRRRTC